IFRVERQGQTLSSLAMLPQGVRRVAYDKLLGIIPALGAAGFYMLLSLPFIAKDIFRIIGDFNINSQSDWLVLIGLLLVMAQAIFFLHLVANLSLRVKRGALPLAIAIHLLITAFMGLTTIGLLRDQSGPFFILLLTVGATIFLHVNTGQRLEELAAED